MKEILNRVLDEYEASSRLSSSSRALIIRELDSDDCYDAISVAADCRLLELASKIAGKVSHPDQMVRWITIGVLLGRFKLPEYVPLGLNLARNDDSLLVRGEALTSLGRVLPFVDDATSRKEVASYLVNVLEDPSEDNSIREGAYDGIRVATDGEEEMQPLQPFHPSEDIDPVVVSRFLERFAHV